MEVGVGGGRSGGREFRRTHSLRSFRPTVKPMHIWQKDSYAGEHKVERERQLVGEREERNLTPEKTRPRGKTGWQEWKDSWRTEDGDD